MIWRDRKQLETQAVYSTDVIERGQAHQSPNACVYLALAVAMAAFVVLGGQPARAQGQCTQSCHASYAQCYKSTGSNRKVCEAQLQQCLSGCINKRQ